ncbi:MAG: glycosyltransferase family 2 protein [Odoribacter sp.]
MCSIHTFLLNRHFLSNDSDHSITEWSDFPDTSILQGMAAKDFNSEYLLLYTGLTPVHLLPYAIERMVQAAEMSGADLIYSDYFKMKEGIRTPHPTLEYQSGSLRDDFDFGPLMLYRRSAFCEAVRQMDQKYRYAALYDLRLKISQAGTILRIPEFLYTVTETDLRLSGEQQFDYVNPKNREVQIEMEAACTSHLKAIGAYLSPKFKSVSFDQGNFPVEASVIIPVKNRIKTIAEAVKSALHQQTVFPFNVIVVDNHSTDGTSEILAELSQQYPSLIHHTPVSQDLGIGGCWTEATMLPECGKFTVQLDSDDLYNSPHVVQMIVEAFYGQNCAMLIGSYQMVNFKLEEIPPGIIDHREWTPDNGRNNALRINGLGAPRAFYTPVLRQIKFPNVSYGEDYAVGLAISRSYRIGRIYEPLYLCRRWEENSDAALDIHRLNAYNFYKDKIRTLELLERKRKINTSGEEWKK